MPELTLDVGNKGGGKTTLEAFWTNYTRQKWQRVPIISNTPIWFANLTLEQKEEYRKDENMAAFGKPHAILNREILKWLAVKTVLRDRRYAMVIVDEAAIAEDLESRGSQSYSTAPKTYLIALSRKVNTDIHVVSQMMSMTDKRIQWLGDNYILCIGHYLPETNTPEYFEYQVHDQGLQKVNTLDIMGEDAQRWLYPRFLTEDLPLSNDKIQEFIQYFKLKPKDYDSFRADMLRFHEQATRTDAIEEATDDFLRNVDIDQEARSQYKESMGPP